jgi:hypothetical protein
MRGRPTTPLVLTASSAIQRQAVAVALPRPVENIVSDLLRHGLLRANGTRWVLCAADGQRNRRDHPAAFRIGIQRAKSASGRRAYRVVGVERVVR